MGIRRQRKLADIRQVDLAKMVGVTQGMVSQCENGDFMPRTDKLPLIALTLQCTIDDLLDSNDRMEQDRSVQDKEAG